MMSFDSNTGEYYSSKSILDMEPTIEQIFNYLGLGTIAMDEDKLINRINKDRMPIRINRKILQGLPQINTNEAYLICSIELKTKARVESLFDENITSVPDNLYKINSIRRNKSSKEVNISNKNLIISKNDMTSKRDEIIAYYIAAKKKEHPTPSQLSKKKLRKNIDLQRSLKFEEYLFNMATKSNITETCPKAIYKALGEPTITNLNTALNKFDPKLFKINNGTQEPFKNFWRSQTVIPVLTHGTGKGRNIKI